MAYKFRNLTNGPILILGSRKSPRDPWENLELLPERDWGRPPYPVKVSHADELQVHHPASGVTVDVRLRKAARVENLPDPEPFTIFVVDRDVAEAVPHRQDLVYIARTTTINDVPFVKEFATALLGGTPVRLP